MTKIIYLKYAKDKFGREDKVHASIKKNFSQIKSQPYDKEPLHTVFLEIEIEIPDDLFKVKKVKVKKVGEL